MRKLYLSLSAFVFVSLFTFTLDVGKLNHDKNIKKNENFSQVKAYRAFVPEPKLVGAKSHPLLTAPSVYAVDVESGVVLFEKNSDMRLLPASTTKIVTALVAMDYYSLNSVLTVPDFIIEGQTMKLFPGEKITVRNLIYGLLVYSANDAAEVLARNYPGGRDSFVTAMNLKAWELGLRDSYFENPTGFDGQMQYITASDLVKIANFAIQNTFFKEVVATKEIVVGSEDGKYIHHLVNINKLLGEVEGVVGIKTGWTENARENLVTYVERGQGKVITVVLGSHDRFADTKQLIEWIFENYNWENESASKQG